MFDSHSLGNVSSCHVLIACFFRPRLVTHPATITLLGCHIILTTYSVIIAFLWGFI